MWQLWLTTTRGMLPILTSEMGWVMGSWRIPTKRYSKGNPTHEQLVGGLEPWNFEWLSRNSWEWNVIPTDELTPSFFRGVGWNHQPEQWWCTFLSFSIHGSSYPVVWREWAELGLSIFSKISGKPRLELCIEFTENHRGWWSNISDLAFTLW